ncbi:hypothetical protein RhoFasK5_03446|nr:hypothetical protein [Rhodococcus kroppenstedtii]
MWLQDVERNVLGGYLMHPEITMAAADGMRRTVPTHRDYFDDFLFTATAMAVGEGDGYTFVRACLAYKSVVGAELDSTPPLVPPAVAAVVSDVVGRFEGRSRGDQRVPYRGNITRTQLDLAEELYLTLGEDLGDGPHAAGARVHSRMLSARIADGFVHPVVGAHIWSDIPAAPARRPGSGRAITVLDDVDAAVRTWAASPAERPEIERVILDAAHGVGWNR